MNFLRVVVNSLMYASTWPFCGTGTDGIMASSASSSRSVGGSASSGMSIGSGAEGASSSSIVAATSDWGRRV
jgi:hypothetical protein